MLNPYQVMMPVLRTEMQKFNFILQLYGRDACSNWLALGIHVHGMHCDERQRRLGQWMTRRLHLISHDSCARTVYIFLCAKKSLFEVSTV